jgi:hypothetical protein
MKRIRIGQYVIGSRINIAGHALFGNFMIGKVADTMGVVNTIPNSKDQMLFIDYDTNIADAMKEIRKMKLTGLFFSSSTKNQETHYFFISPFHYTPLMIREILAKSEFVDGKFVAVYMRDKVNAIRLVPKSIGKNQSRTIKLLFYLSFDPLISSRIAVSGMFNLIQEFYPNVTHLITDSFFLDTTVKNDINIREYETIRW